MSLNENKGHGTGGKLCRKQAKLAPLDPFRQRGHKFAHKSDVKSGQSQWTEK